MRGFRVWSNYWKMYAFDAELYGDGSLYAMFEDDDGVTHHENTDLVLEFDTGLKDKNGKEIYEGDVVNIQGIKYYVDFEYGGFWFNNDNRKWKANRPFTHFQEINDAEVIGNIHENPELLKEEE